MKRISALILAAALLASLAGCGNASGTSSTSAPQSTSASSTADGLNFDGLDDVVLIGADNSSKGAAAQLLGELVSEKVDEITQGKLTIDYFTNSALGDDADILRQVYANDIQIAVCQTAPVVAFVPEVAVFDLPMVFAKYDGDTIETALSGEGSAFRQGLDAAYENSGFHLLGLLQNATYRLTSANVELNSLADFSTLQIRTMNNSNHMAFWTAIGAEPTPLAWSEVYFALQSGTIAAEENAADTILGANLNEVQSVLACTNHILYLNQICINKDAYADLAPAYQAALDQAVKEAITELRPQLSDIDNNNKQALVDKGMKLIEYDESFYDQILALDTVQALYADIDSQVGGLGATLQEELARAAG